MQREASRMSLHDANLAVMQGSSTAATVKEEEKCMRPFVLIVAG